MIMHRKIKNYILVIILYIIEKMEDHMDDKNIPQRRLNRRDFLKLSAVTGAAVVGGYVLSEYTPWLNYEQQVEND